MDNGARTDASVPRGPDGRFLPGGASPNPAGRVKVAVGRVILAKLGEVERRLAAVERLLEGQGDGR